MVQATPLTRITPSLCARCKGVRRLCGLPRCPLLLRAAQQLRVSAEIAGRREIYSPTPPSILVGERGYPSVSAGPNIAPGAEAPERYENPREWWGRLTLEDIIRLRTSLVHSAARMDARRPSGRIAEAIREAALSSKPVYSEVRFRKPPRPSPLLDPMLKPIGLRGEVEEIRISENPAIPRRVDAVIEEKVPARAAVVELYLHGYDVYYLQRVLSAALLGRSPRLVPTRWAITAVDKTVSDTLLRRVRGYPEIPGYEVYHVEYLGNRYTILLAPAQWSLEMVEVWLPHSVWMRGEKPYIYRVYEYWDGKANDMDGGYYAIRLPLLEALEERRRQAAAIVVREVTPSYYAPVGSWQIRESIRNALRRKPLKPRSIEEAVKILDELTILPAEELLRGSRVYALLRGQKRITDYLAMQRESKRKIDDEKY